MIRGAIDRRALLGAAFGAALCGTRAGGVVAQCETVELYPGYPGYRGYITGIDGVGDVACLDELEAAYPWFDRGAEDEANQAAADQIQLAGTPSQWTWENWMVIEHLRGLVPTTCYSCAIAAAPERQSPVGTLVARDDPRLLLGAVGSTFAIGRLLTKHGLPGWTFNNLIQDDHELRALAGMTLPGFWNASQLLDGYDSIASAIADGEWFDFGFLLNTLVTQGGYALTPPTAPPDDQLFMILSAVPVLSRLIGPFGQEVFLQQVRGITSTWRNQLLHDPAAAPPFAVWFGQELEQSGMIARPGPAPTAELSPEPPLERPRRRQV